MFPLGLILVARFLGFLDLHMASFTLSLSLGHFSALRFKTTTLDRKIFVATLYGVANLFHRKVFFFHGRGHRLLLPIVKNFLFLCL